MRVGSPEYWKQYDQENDSKMPTYAAQIRAIQAKLDRGTAIIKEGHRIANLNPGGNRTEVPLTPKQVNSLRWNLKVLSFRLIEGHPGALGYTLPDHLNKDNPQVAIPTPAWKYFVD
jgi:hypothetical protein